MNVVIVDASNPSGKPSTIWFGLAVRDSLLERDGPPTAGNLFHRYLYHLLGMMLS